jgi:hypothetical protein
MGSNENNARGDRKPVREITKQCQLEKTRHQIGRTRAKAARSGAPVVAHFCHSVGGFLLFQSRNQSASVFFPGNYLSKSSGTRGAKGTVVLLRAGIDKGAQLDWRGHRCKISGALADTKGGNPIELLLLLALGCN